MRRFFDDSKRMRATYPFLRCWEEIHAVNCLSSSTATLVGIISVGLPLTSIFVKEFCAHRKCTFSGDGRGGASEGRSLPTSNTLSGSDICGKYVLYIIFQLSNHTLGAGTDREMKGRNDLRMGPFCTCETGETPSRTTDTAEKKNTKKLGVYDSRFRIFYTSKYLLKASPTDSRKVVCVCVRLHTENSETTMSISQTTPDEHPPTPPPCRWPLLITLPTLAKFQLVWRRLCDVVLFRSSCLLGYTLSAI